MSEDFWIDEARKMMTEDTDKAHKTVEKERKRKHYLAAKRVGQHRTVLIPFELDAMLKAEATRRQISISDAIRLCLTHSLKTWN